MVSKYIDADEFDSLLETAQTALETRRDSLWEKNKGIHKGLAIARSLLRSSRRVSTEAVWVSVNDREPNEDGVYLVTISWESNGGLKLTTTTRRYETGIGFCYKVTTVDGYEYRRSNDVTHWARLPSPATI